MRYLNLILDEISTWKWVVFILILFPYAWKIRVAKESFSLDFAKSMNQWDIILEILSDPYFIFYFVLPLWLFFSSQIIKQEWEYTVHIRLRNLTKWIIHTLICISPLLLVLHFFWIIISLLVTVGIPLEDSWSGNGSDINIPLNYLVQPFKDSGISPWAILIIQPVLLSLFFTLLHVIMATFFIIVPKKRAIAVMSIFLYTYSIVSFKLFSPDMLWGKLENYMILSFAYGAFNSIVTPFLVIIIVVIFCFLLVFLFQRSQFHIVKEFTAHHFPTISYILLCIIGIVTPIVRADFLTVWDRQYYQFFGVSEDGFSITVYFYYCIVFMGLVYLFRLYLTPLLDGLIYYQLIRYTSLYRWFFQLIGKMIVVVISFLLLLTSVTIIIGYLQGQSLDLQISVSQKVTLSHLGYHFFVNGFLQILNYVLIIFIVIWIYKEAIYSLIALGALIVAGLPMINVYKCLPSGLNSLGYVTGDFSELIHITVVLIIFLVVELVIIFYFFYKQKIAY
ncbi:hypothetical protein M670_01399 [Schinkia azotoformans MEV2011]|uniref:Permease n=1 Tax=Schinkia azotoformans MEV2011 TaxID=1348973 RepID=A0A072NQZ0_SCHAZ|nr:hypothetical protein [Schinkia azotoformans]KEF39622.1 hypothetical protein M670_01399 [Schinkia azotoformans MEV2011]MEC1698261.1 hypothetical protein [Schinkia azotoformans]MEC1727597.1 hypothetical protein [Schinkia azotoformans]MEC1741698.1 hypothetical protein [Schinkia azotoformans]MEC1768101.1 hypothetical protein [Schinkia azotoformans]